LAEVALALRDRVELPPRTRYRLVGVGLAHFDESEPSPQDALFDASIAGP
jgi:DNA polymerase-4